MWTIFFIFSNSNNETDYLKNELSNKFKIKDLGELKSCLGMRVGRDENGISLDQERYIEQVLEKFGMSDCKPIGTPICKSDFDVNEGICDRNLPYRKLIGSLMYLSILTRPDITFAVNYLSQFNNCYNEIHWRQAKRILRYLKGSKSMCLRFVKGSNNSEDLLMQIMQAMRLIAQIIYGLCI